MVFDPETAHVPDAALSRLPEDPTRGLTIEGLEVEGRRARKAARYYRAADCEDDRRY
jgi:hypothetical protein